MPDTRKKSEADTRLDGPIEIPDEASPKDAERINRVNRNCVIRKEFERMEDEMQSHLAIQRLAWRFDVSVSLIRKVISGDR